MSKAVALYNLLQEGGVEKHTHITASDKDWKLIVTRMFMVCSVTTWKHQKEMTGLYGEDEFSKIEEGVEKVAGTHEDEEDYSIIEVIFGNSSKLDYQSFINKITTDCKWIFDPVEIRDLVFKKGAEVDMKHISA